MQRKAVNLTLWIKGVAVVRKEEDYKFVIMGTLLVAALAWALVIHLSIGSVQKGERILQLEDEKAVLEQRVAELEYEILNPGIETPRETPEPETRVEPLPEASAPVAEPLRAPEGETGVAQIPETGATVRGYWMNEVISPTYEYNRKLFIGREVVQGHYIDYVDEAYMQDAILVYCNFKKDKWLEKMNATGCIYYQDKGHMVRYLTSRGKSWEMALIVLEFESSFGPGASSNPFGFVGGGYSNLEMYCDFLDNGLGYRCPDDPVGFVDYYHNPAQVEAHAKYMENFCNRLIQIQAFCP